MNWRDKLAKKYPVLYRDYKGDMRYTCMAWGFSVDDGWSKLIEDLSRDITAIDPEGRIRAAQVKEKYGRLCFYFNIDSINSKITRLKIWWYRICFWARIHIGIKLFHYTTIDKIGNFRKRFYKNLWERVAELVDKAESDSCKICETCGSPGAPTNDGWVITICDSCAKKRENKL